MVHYDIMLDYNARQFLLHPKEQKWLYQSGRSPKVVAISATNISSNKVWLIQLHDAM